MNRKVRIVVVGSPPSADIQIVTMLNLNVASQMSDGR